MAQLTRKSIGKLVKYSRETQNHTIYRVCKDTKIKISQLQGIETGELNATIQTYLILFKYLKIEGELSFNQKRIKLKKQ